MAEMINKWTVLAKIITLEGEYVCHKEDWDAQDLFYKICSLEEALRGIDALDLVRCRDCKRFVDNKEARVTYCNRGLKMWYMRPGDFCSHGERRDNGNL